MVQNEEVQALARSKGITVEHLLDSYELGEAGMKSWEGAGQQKKLEDVLRKDIAEIVSEVRALQRV
ncbi:MAG: hypothetical protein Q8P12_06905 [bacterium]|nr:hypothetical protein [bacterium]